MLLSLPLANKTLFPYLFLFFLIVLKNVLNILILTRNTKLIRALDIPKGASIAVANEQKQTLLLSLDRTNKVLPA